MPTTPKLPRATVLALHSASGMTYQQIADQYGVTKAAVQMAMHRAGLRSRLPRPTPAERFLAKVDMQHPSGCWMWTGSRGSNGYGQFRAHRGSPVPAHRFGYELWVGPIPDGYELDHLCRTPSCVHPAHLEAVTPRVNNLRSTSPAAGHAQQTHCVNGHELTGENVYAYRGRRMCRACMRARKNTSAYRERENQRRRARYAERTNAT
jgi:hypothetical protein